MSPAASASPNSSVQSASSASASSSAAQSPLNNSPINRTASALAAQLPQAVVQSTVNSLRNLSFDRSDAHKQALSYREFDRVFLQRPLNIASSHGGQTLSFSVAELLQALGVNKASLKGSSVNHWKNGDWTRDIDLLINTKVCGKNRDALVAALKAYLQQGGKARYTLSERTVNKGLSQFYKVQIGFPKEGGYRIDLVIADSMDVKFDVLQASSEIEFDTASRAATLKQLDRPPVLDWLREHKLLCFHPEMTGGLERLSIYCQKGSHYLLQPEVLEKFVADAEPADMANVLMRQFGNLKNLSPAAQQKLWQMLVGVLMEQPSEAPHLLNYLAQWSGVDTLAQLPAALNDPSRIARLGNGYNIGADIRDTLKQWLLESPQASRLVQQVFEQLLDVQVVPLPTLLTALKALPPELDYQSPTLAHGVLPAVEYWLGQDISADNRQQLQNDAAELKQLPLRQCMHWLKQNPDFGLLENRQHFVYLLKGVIDSSGSGVSMGPVSGSINEPLMRVIQVLQGTRAGRTGLRLVCNALQKSRLRLESPTLDELRGICSKDNTASPSNKLLLLCVLGASIQRLAEQKFRFLLSDASLHKAAQCIEALFKHWPDVKQHFYMERGIAWFKTSDPKADGIHWAWDPTFRRLLVLDKDVQGNRLIAHCDGVDSHILNFNKNFQPVADYILVAGDYPPVDVAFDEQEKEWSIHADWPVAVWKTGCAKAWIKEMCSVHSLFREGKANPEAFNVSLLAEFQERIPVASAQYFEQAIFEQISKGTMRLKTSNHRQTVSLMIAGGKPMSFSLSHHEDNPYRRLHFMIPDLPGETFYDRIDVQREYLDNALVNDIPEAIPNEHVKPTFSAPYHEASGKLMGLGFCQSADHSIFFKGLIVGDQMMGPGTVRFDSNFSEIELPASLNNKVIPMGLLELMELIDVQNPDLRYTLRYDEVRMGEGVALPADYEGFVHFEGDSYQMRGYVFKQVFVGECAVKTEDWSIRTGRHWMVPAEAGALGSSVVHDAGLRSKFIDLPWGLRLLSHGFVCDVQSDSPTYVKNPQPRTNLFFKGHELRLDRDTLTQHALNMRQLKISPPKTPIVLRLAAGGPGEWRSIQIMFTPNEKEDRIVFSSEIAGSRTPKRILVVAGEGRWVQLRYVSPLLFSTHVVLGGGFHYKGMLMSKGEMWYPLPVGELGMSGVRWLLLKGIGQNLDGLLEGPPVGDAKINLAMQELNGLLGQANSPLTAQEYVRQLSSGMAELMAPMFDGTGTVPLAQRRRYP